MSAAKNYAVLVTGSRNWRKISLVRHRLELYDQAWRVAKNNIILIHGDASGADQHGKVIGQELNWSIIGMPAQWTKHGKSAGPLRNQEILNILKSLREVGFTTVVEAFPLQNSIGTYHMIKLARAEEFNVFENPEA